MWGFGELACRHEDRERLRTLVEGEALPALSSSASRANERQRPVGDEPQRDEANDDRSTRMREKGDCDNDGDGDREGDGRGHNEPSPLRPIYRGPRLTQRSPVPPPTVRSRSGLRRRPGAA